MLTLHSFCVFGRDARLASDGYDSTDDIADTKHITFPHTFPLLSPHFPARALTPHADNMHYMTRTGSYGYE